MKKKFVSLVFVAGLLFSMSSCAVMFNGTTKRVNITSMTPNSEIYVDGLFVGTEKASVKLKRRHDHLITVKKAGCKQQMVPLDKKFQVEWVLLYMFVNVFAVATDAPTGAWYGFERSQIVVPENDCTE